MRLPRHLPCRDIELLMLQIRLDSSIARRVAEDDALLLRLE